MPSFKFKVTFTGETDSIYADNLDEAKGIVKGQATLQFPRLKLERLEPLKENVKISKNLESTETSRSD